ncbi:MAG: hypothetical protein DWQ37_22725 [Planctomycetota bacterium]|nr:MAG: hypothetical protein DWQ37_22725 [Planctomycetota bacterium]
MGMMKFLVPRRDHVAADAAARAYFAGIDEVPWQTRIHFDGDHLVVQRAEFDSGNLHVPYAVEGHGELILSTASLMERPRPYHLQVELARGTINRLRNQLAAWESLGMKAPPNVREALAAAHGHFAVAATRQDDAQQAAERAESALAAALDGVDRLNEAYVTQALAARHTQHAKLTTLWGVNLGSTVPDATIGPRLVEAFNTVQVPLAWRAIEASEGQHDWSATDAQIDWARAQGFKVCGGPLLSIDRGALPDWMSLFGDDVDNFRSCVREHIQAVVNRYRGKVHLWICSARLNVENDFEHDEEERLRLAVLSIESIRNVDPRSPIVLSIDQPWGAFMRSQECDLSPLHFADALVRAELGLAGIGLEINVGYKPGGSESRDPLEFGRQLDRWSTLGLPLLVSLSAPSGEGPVAGNKHQAKVVPASPDRPWSPEMQRTWGETYLGVLLAKQAVQGMVWNQLLDGGSQSLPHAGLFDDQGQAKPLVELLADLRREHLA